MRHTRTHNCYLLMVFFSFPTSSSLFSFLTTPHQPPTQSMFRRTNQSSLITFPLCFILFFSSRGNKTKQGVQKLLYRNLGTFNLWFFFVLFLLLGVSYCQQDKECVRGERKGLRLGCWAFLVVPLLSYGLMFWTSVFKINGVFILLHFFFPIFLSSLYRNSECIPSIQTIVRTLKTSENYPLFFFCR